MARKLGEAFVLITANLRGLKEGLERASSLTQKAVADISEQLNIVDRALGGLMKTGIGLSVGVSLPIALASKNFIALGSEAIELDNRFHVTFGDMAKDVEDWSRRLGRAFGRSTIDVQGFAQSFNTMLTPVGLGREATAAMSKELTALVFDFGSFSDLAPEEAFIKLQSGLAGMSRPLLKFIGEVSETTTQAFALKIGMIEAGEQMNEAQKIVARFGLIMQRSAEMQGDAIRTGRDWANQIQRMLGAIKDISAAIGRAMIPFLSIFLRLLNDMILPIALMAAEWFAMHPVLSGIITAFVGLVAVIGPLLVVTVAMIGLWLKLRIGANILKFALFALNIKIKGVTISNWIMNRSFIFTKAVVDFVRSSFLKLKLAMASTAAGFKVASISAISFSTIWTGAAGVIAAGAALVAGAFRLMWAAILGPAGLAIIAITALVFLLEHLLAKKAMKGIREETDAMNKALKALSGGVSPGGAGGTADLGRTVSTPVLGQLAAGGAGFSQIFGGAAGALGIKPRGDQLVAGKIDRTNELLAELVSTGPVNALVLN